VLYEGSYFGEGSILGDVRRTESVRARTSCSLCALEVSGVNRPEYVLRFSKKLDTVSRCRYLSRHVSFSRICGLGSVEIVDRDRQHGRGDLVTNLVFTRGLLDT
jgi:hypothetical protein